MGREWAKAAVVIAGAKQAAQVLTEMFVSWFYSARLGGKNPAA